MKLFGRKAEKEKQSKFQAIYEKYRYTMYSVAFNITKNSYDAEDVIQSSSMKLLKILHKVAWEDIFIGRYSSPCTFSNLSFNFC